MIALQFSKYDFRIRSQDGKDEIFDAIRRKWIILTPEEWVRQNLINYLITECKIPASLIAVERKVVVGELNRRFDIVVYDRQMKPWLIVECKAGSVSLSGQTISQVLSYVYAVPARFIVISNGLHTYGWEIVNGSPNGLEHLPFFAG